MNIHMISSMRNFDEDLPFVQAIIDVIQAQGNSLALNWFDAAKTRRERNPETALLLDWQEQVEENVDAIIRADAVIIEGSRFNYSQGYQTAIALQHNKPVLNLYRKDLPEYQEWPDKNFVSGISSPLFKSIAYEDKDDLQNIVTKFLDETRPKATEVNVRFMLDNEIYTKLKGVMDANKTSEASTIKSILAKELS